MRRYGSKKVSFDKYYGADGPRASKAAQQRLKKLNKFYELKRNGCVEAAVLQVLEVSRASIYRWQKEYKEYGISGLESDSRAPLKVPKHRYSRKLVELVLKLRRENPIWGKAKIHAIISRDYRLKISVSTVGRILQLLVKKGFVKPYWYYFGRIRPKQSRQFNKHAKRWKYGIKPKSPGDLIQIDHAVIEAAPGRYIKQFDATCPITKLSVSQVYHQATSRISAQFLDYIQLQFPFKINSIQVDGGSEFMHEFEQSCQKQKIELFVLPPKSPKFNGNVERRHATIKYEFFATYDGGPSLEEIRPKLAQFMLKYNHYRPHQALDFETPWSFYLKLED